ncbi:hypothetical protein CupriaWKF_15085 [Cupriavidus sp. WKF15]|uniref:hypothetical protein n=1 Tax=Cupriavidus sp. WKF15 TaxID=3032282 RepID=UPI0023E23DF4|nr:hypothetical protein [Cupriavidus sp. WKF15]WER45602.1 hypothetical protein CupriaWKF_15085 [Cupriavidus sp. WKF15]
MEDGIDLPSATQQDLLRYAMNVLGYTRKQLADRIGTRKRALDNWLTPNTSPENREMPEMARRFILEILPREVALATKCPKCGWMDGLASLSADATDQRSTENDVGYLDSAEQER